MKFSIFRTILHMNKAGFVETAKKIAKKDHKLTLFVMLDMIYCGLRFKAGYIDYYTLQWNTLTHRQRKTYTTRGIICRLVALLNDPAYNSRFDSKIQFNETFAPYIHREWIRARDLSLGDFQAFLAKHPVIIAKPDEDTCGKGVQKFTLEDFEGNVEAMHAALCRGQFGLLEECIQQHPEISRLYPHAVNTIRFCTLLKDGIPHILYTVLRLGNNGKCVDNFLNGGVCAFINSETGAITSVATDDTTAEYPVHPYTKEPIPGFQIPFFAEAAAMVKEAMQVVPQTRYIGWDVAITPEGPLLIEGNRHPGDLIYPVFLEDKIGYLPRYKAILGDEWEKLHWKI